MALVVLLKNVSKLVLVSAQPVAQSGRLAKARLGALCIASTCYKQA
jgi:hypothetical protein